jgi:hypothetical protein
MTDIESLTLFDSDSLSDRRAPAQTPSRAPGSTPGLSSTGQVPLVAPFPTAGG